MATEAFGVDMVKAVTGEEITQNGLGGMYVHAETSGVCHFAYDDEETCIREVRYLLSLLPQNNRQARPRVERTDPVERRGDVLLDLAPVDNSGPYDMVKVIEELVDDGDHLEVHERWARNIICTPARLDGQVVGIVAGRPQTPARVVDIEVSEKATRFIQIRDAFDVPIVTFLDVPVFLLGAGQEHGGIIRHGAKLLYACCNATVPRISLILRGIRRRVHRHGQRPSARTSPRGCSESPVRCPRCPVRALGVPDEIPRTGRTWGFGRGGEWGHLPRPQGSGGACRAPWVLCGTFETPPTRGRRTRSP